MSAIKISENVYEVGVQDPDLKIFDITMPTEYGTTYNSYLVIGEKVALIDAVKKEFTDQFFANIEEIIPIDKIDYLIVNHTEPDHSGAIPALLERNPNIKLIASATAVPYVKAVINCEADLTGVKDKHELDLGGKTLTFRLMPYMHWPDTMMEYLAEDKILFSNDGFAAHVCSETLWADEVPAEVDLDHQIYYYWDCIMRPFSGFIRRNLLKLDDHEIEMIATSHGPLFRKNARSIIDKYKEWTADKSEGSEQISIFYASNYGNTEKLAIGMADELTNQNFTPVLVDATNVESDRVKELIESSKAIMIGTPTFNGDAVKPIWDLTMHFSTVYSIGKKAAVFGSYGWGGEGTKLVAARLSGLKLKVFEEEFRARLIPSGDEMNDLKSYVERLAQYFRAGK